MSPNTLTTTWQPFSAAACSGAASQSRSLDQAQTATRCAGFADERGRVIDHRVAIAQREERGLLLRHGQRGEVGDQSVGEFGGLPLDPAEHLGRRMRDEARRRVRGDAVDDAAIGQAGEHLVDVRPGQAGALGDLVSGRERLLQQGDVDAGLLRGEPERAQSINHME